jgi:putative nucleotidyltransferase with HDIG domain
MSDACETNTLERLCAAADDLPTIPESLSRILSVLEDPDSGARDLADVVRTDAPLASKIVRLANSPLYRLHRQVESIQDCVAALGYATVRQVALCVAVVSSLGSTCGRRGATVDYRELWRHCVAAGAVARVLAQSAGIADPEAAFTRGLLHDVGKFVMILRFPRQYGEAIYDRRTRGCSLVEVERERFGFDHAEAGAALAEHWHFPADLVGAIAGHHDPSPDDPSVAVVALADILAYGIHSPACDLGGNPAGDTVPALLDCLDISPDALESWQGTLAQAVDHVAPLAQLD